MEILLNGAGFIVPIGLAALCSISWMQRNKIRKATLSERKEYYWNKNINGNEKIEKRLDNREIIPIEIVGVMEFWLILCGLYIFDLYNYEPLKALISADAFMFLVEINIGILTIISLVTVLKKDFYLGIDVKDVLKIYAIPDLVIRVLIYSGIVFLLYAIYNIMIIRENELFSLCVEMAIYTVFLWVLCLLGCLIYKTVNMYINDCKKEFKAFKCLRFRIVYEYLLRKNEIVNSGAIEKITMYLLEEIIKYYRKFEVKSDKLVEIRYDSAIRIMTEKISIDKKIIQKFNISGTKGIVLFTVIVQGWMIWLQLAEAEPVGNISLIIFEIILTIGLIILGVAINAWNVYSVGNNFWVFKYANSEKIAAHGLWGGYNKGYEFIGAIEDLICFYKILLYNKQGKKLRKLIIRKIKEKLRDDEKQIIRNTILLLLYYLDYEKCYLKSEERAYGKYESIEGIKKRTEHKIQQNSIYNYMEMIKWFENIDEKSVEYQLADSILKHVYKEPEIMEDGTLNPQKLRNYKFEYYFKLIKSKVADAKKDYDIRQAALECVHIDKIIWIGSKNDKSSNTDPRIGIAILGDEEKKKFLKSEEFEKFKEKLYDNNEFKNYGIWYFQNGKNKNAKKLKTTMVGNAIYEK